MDIYFYEAFEEEMNLLKTLLGRDLIYEFTSTTVQETRHKKPPARLISIRTQSIVPPSWAEELDGVLSRSTGFDHLLEYQSQIKKRLPLGYLEEYSTRAVAEHAVMMTMALLRKLPQQMRQFGVFDRDGLTGAECLGKNLLVVGVGRIGSEVVKLAKALGFAVKGVDIVPNKAEVVYVSREEGIPWAEVIICAMNLTKQNEGYFSHDLLKTARKGCVFVNVARGEHSPLAGLKRLLDERHLAGVGLDVFEDEGRLAASLRNSGAAATSPLTLISQLLGRSNVLLTPHNAFNTQEALQRKAAMSVEQIRHFLKHRDFVWRVEYLV